jgi:dipeptidase E
MLVLFGGGDSNDNRSVDRRLISSLPKNPKFTFIPAWSYESHLDFKDFVTQYKKFGVKRFFHFPIDTRINNMVLNEALDSDLIHLSGGNTFYFLYHLKKAKLFPKLKSFVKKGGVLTGLSAGGIIMTPTITTASFPSFDCDDNDLNITDWKSLNLIPIDFFPHYVNSKRYSDALKKYTKTTNYPLYAIPDGSAIFYSDKKIEIQGNCWVFEAGEKKTIK